VKAVESEWLSDAIISCTTTNESPMTTYLRLLAPDVGYPSNSCGLIDEQDFLGSECNSHSVHLLVRPFPVIVEHQWLSVRQVPEP
jgi:hypothetical protein